MALGPGVALEHPAVSQMDLVAARRVGSGVQLRDPPKKAGRVDQLVEHGVQQVGVSARHRGDGRDPPHLQEPLVEAQDPAPRVDHQQAVGRGPQRRLVKRESPRMLLGGETLIGDVPHETVEHRPWVIQLERGGDQAHRGRALGRSPAPGLEVDRLAAAQLVERGLHVRRLVERAEQLAQLAPRLLRGTSQHAPESRCGTQYPAVGVEKRQPRGRDVESRRHEACPCVDEREPSGMIQGHYGAVRGWSTRGGRNPA